MAAPSTPFRLSQPALRVLRSAVGRRPFSSRQQPPSPLPLPAPFSNLPRPRPAGFHHALNNNNSTPTTSNHVARMHTTQPTPRQRKPLAHNREEVPDQPPPTDFGQLDVLGSAPVPTTAVEVCHDDGFSLNSGLHIRGGAGALLVGGEAFVWRPWLLLSRGNRRGLVNSKGQWEVGEEGFAVLGAVWPRPDLLILGLGPEIRPLSPATRKAITNLGMRVEVLDTRNAASQYNMLATERGMDDVAAALIPIGWNEGAQ